MWGGVFLKNVWTLVCYFDGGFDIYIFSRGIEGGGVFSE